MKPEFDREIDALLRSRSRKVGARDEPARDGRSLDRVVAPNDHLGADELAAFAENALPAATRTRYFAHLADCDDCRRTATRLALAANISHAPDESKVVAANKNDAVEKIVAASWRERVAALFAPRAWRYAMPVVALLCVGVIAFVVMRRVPNSALELARNDEESQRARAATSVAHDENHATAATAGEPAGDSTQTESYNSNGAIASKQASSEDKRGAANVSNDQISSPTASGAVGGTTANSASGGARTETATRQIAELPTVIQQSPVGTPMPVPAPPREAQTLPSLAQQPTPAPPANVDSLELAKEEKSKKGADALDRTQAQARERRAQTRDEAESVNGQRAANRPASRNEAGASATSSGETANAAPKTSARRVAPARDDSRKDEDRAADSSLKNSSAVETRAVAGRKFRREGDAWIDTAYKSGEATTVVRRNSEQFRALVSDEPEIGRIANALGGEVVVVWRGRAYRIKS